MLHCQQSLNKANTTLSLIMSYPSTGYVISMTFKSNTELSVQVALHLNNKS